MKNKRLFPKLSYDTYASKKLNSWFHIDKFWRGNLIAISIKHHTIWLDFVKDWEKMDYGRKVE